MRNHLCIFCGQWFHHEAPDLGYPPAFGWCGHYLCNAQATWQVTANEKAEIAFEAQGLPFIPAGGWR